MNKNCQVILGKYNEIEVPKLTHGDKGLNPWRLER